VVPGVTGLLDKMGYLAGVPRSILDSALHRGTRVHTACELDDEGNLDEETAADVMGYVKSWRNFSDAHQVRWIHIEQPMYHSVLRYAGKPDRIGLVATNGASRTLVDIKSGPWHPIIAAQLAAYSRLSDACGVRSDCAMSVHLSADGQPRVRELSIAELNEGWALFTGLLNAHNWKAKYL